MNEVGIDISEHQKYIDFNKLKNSECKYVIIRIGWIGNRNNHKIDNYFEQYYQKAKEQGFAIGFYVYNYCKSVQALDNACQWIEKQLKNKSFELPLFLDMEDETKENGIAYLGKENLTNQCIYFCEYFKKRGFKTGIYANKNWFTNYLDITKLLNYKIWLAEWGKKITLKYRVDLWQYGKSEKPGIYGGVDTNKNINLNIPQPVNNSVEKGVFIDMKTFKNNGNYKSLVFCDSNCTNSIGWLNHSETCECFGIFENGKGERVVGVIYTIDNSKPVNRKVGYTKIINGVVI